MTFYHLCKASLFLFLLHLIPRTDGKTSLEVAQLIKAEAGQSVTINCSFVPLSSSFTTKWMRGCDHHLSLTDQTCYNGRIHISHGDPNNIKTDSGVSKAHSTLTINHVTENDSGMYCCQVETTRGQKTNGSSTRLEVTPRTSSTNTAGTNQAKEIKLYVLYGLVGAETCIILVLLVVGVKYCLKGSSKIENKFQVFGEEMENEPKLHYAEICQANRQKRARVKRPEERVTYAPVKMRH